MISEMPTRLLRPYSGRQLAWFQPKPTSNWILQALHRVRSHLVSERTAVINRIRGFLLERGIIVRQGLRFLRQ
jgi:transposase